MSDRVQVGVSLEARERGPGEGERTQQGEEHKHHPTGGRDSLSAGDHQRTSARLARRSMSRHTPSRTGNMKTPIAAPSARLPLSMPV